jgi:hypothetical protein
VSTPIAAAVDAAAGREAFGPWNPGLESQVPRRLRHLVTIFRPEHAFNDCAKAQELADLTGLGVTELASLRPQRLALHELLVRVTADFTVPDGSRIEDLGINFREIVRALHVHALAPRTAAIVAAYDDARRALASAIDRELAAYGRASREATNDAPRSWWQRAFGARRPEPDVDATSDDAGQRLVARWEREAKSANDEVERAACAALARVVSALLVRHGRLWGERALLASLALDIACNDYAGRAIGALMEPWLEQAAIELGYRRLPPQPRPVVMNTKGPSASGKSTLRPLQRRLAGEVGVDWADFALISPDIWRKQLVDYASLGGEYKYGGAFTGDEVQIIDQKLDRYMAAKARRGAMSHLLIDRFRFDSFAPDSDEAGSNLLTRFGQVIYLFFMITPPASLVERAWTRGLEVGRYKAVDDTLAHGIEAYSGMPELFFTWIARADKEVHFEFLDNSVRFGERPRTVAFGTNAEINVLDVKCLIDVERYRRVDVNASGPESLFADPAALAADANSGFLRQCAQRFRVVNFADQASGRIYLSLQDGVPKRAARAALAAAAADPDTRDGLLAVAPGAFAEEMPEERAPRHVTADAGGRRQTLGAWGGSAMPR